MQLTKSMRDIKPVILLFGMPRSGTTWIGKIFDSHPDTLYRHEPDTWLKINEIPLLAESKDYKKYCNYLSDYISAFESINLPQITSKFPLFRKNYSSWLGFNVYRLSAYLSSLLGRIRPSILIPTFSPINKSRTNKIIMVWKSIQLLGRMGVIVRCIDGCKVIHIVRHPCGYVSSVLRGEEKNKFVSSIPASEDYNLLEMLMKTKQAKTYGLDIETLKALEPVERLTWRWILFNEKVLDDTENMLNVIMLRYEELCASPIQKAKEIFKFSNLGWSAQTEEFLLKSTGVSNNSYYSVYKNPLESANKWKDSMDKNDIKKIISIMKMTRIGKLYLGL